EERAMASSKPKRRPRRVESKARPVGVAGARRRVRYDLLYAIGKELSRAKDVDRLIPNVLSLAASALPLRSAVVALRDDGKTRLIAWPATRVADIERASNHALATFAYLLQDPSLATRGVEI